MDTKSAPTLRDWSLWLRNDPKRVDHILDVAERNSVIEGLPPFDQAVRERLRAELEIMLSSPPSPSER